MVGDKGRGGKWCEPAYIVRDARLKVVEVHRAMTWGSSVLLLPEWGRQLRSPQLLTTKYLLPFIMLVLRVYTF